ncbi:transposase [Lysobacter sp. A3-1-A15]|uniref:transposase n=1 Tax=Novilysobacter viscosus TaxID=3098602 RepID=UPI002ED99461
MVQRGNNRLPCFLDDADRARYRHLLREALLATDCRLHAYVLMDNHVHLLVTPPEAGATGRLMQKLGRQLAAIRAYLQQQRAYGRDTFQAMVKAKTARFAGVRPAHRPPHTRIELE